MSGSLRLVASAAAAALLVGCGAAGPPPPAPAPVGRAPLQADPLFPEGYAGWPAAPPVTDELAGEVRHLHRSPQSRAGAGGRFPEGAFLVKVHHSAGPEPVVTRIDVRQRSAEGPFEGWRYLSFDPATRRQIPADAETCHLCHAAAPADGTFTRFPR